MVIFHSYVSLPEGTPHDLGNRQRLDSPQKKMLFATDRDDFLHIKLFTKDGYLVLLAGGLGS